MLTRQLDSGNEDKGGFSPEVRERAVKLVLEHEGENKSQCAAIESVAAKIGCSAETLRGWGPARGPDDARKTIGPDRLVHYSDRDARPDSTGRRSTS